MILYSEQKQAGKILQRKINYYPFSFLSHAEITKKKTVP